MAVVMEIMYSFWKILSKQAIQIKFSMLIIICRPHQKVMAKLFGLEKIKNVLMNQNLNWHINFFRRWKNLFDLYNVRLVCKDFCKLVNKNPRFKKHIWCSINIISNVEWFENITTVLDRFMNTLKKDMKIYDSNFEFPVKYYIEKIKLDLLNPIVLSDMLFCKRFCGESFDCRKYSRTYIADFSINKSFEYHFMTIYVNSSRNLSPDILEMYLKDNAKSYSMNILFSKASYNDLVRSRESFCVFYQSCNNWAAVFIVCTEILIRIIANYFFYF